MQPDVLVTGTTLSENQRAYATQNAKQYQRQQHLAFHLCNYRHQLGSLDRIGLIGMREHFDMRHSDDYLPQLHRYRHQMG